MRVSCKNAECKHYYELKQGEHCPAEEGCPGYDTNLKKTRKRILRCKSCEYCKMIYTNGGKEYHWECNCKGKRKLLLMIEERICDCEL